MHSPNYIHKYMQIRIQAQCHIYKTEQTKSNKKSKNQFPLWCSYGHCRGVAPMWALSLPGAGVNGSLGEREGGFGFSGLSHVQCSIVVMALPKFQSTLSLDPVSGDRGGWGPWFAPETSMQMVKVSQQWWVLKSPCQPAAPASSSLTNRQQGRISQRHWAPGQEKSSTKNQNHLPPKQDKDSTSPS